MDFLARILRRLGRFFSRGARIRHLRRLLDEIRTEMRHIQSLIEQLEAFLRRHGGNPEMAQRVREVQQELDRLREEARKWNNRWNAAMDELSSLGG